MKSAKILLLIILAFGFFFGFTHKTLAFAPTANYLQFEKAVNAPDMNLESFVATTLKSIPYSFIYPIFCFSCNDAQRKQSSSMISSVQDLLLGVYLQPPASSTKYVADLGQRLSLTKPVSAQSQGFGYSVMLDPLMDIWKVFRNVSYALLAMFFVIIGFMIMFRVKISPQAVVTIQSALPKLVIALVLITFSYAIVGLMIDFTLVITALVAQTFMNDIFPKALPLVGGFKESIDAITKNLGIGDAMLTTYIAQGIVLSVATFLAFIYAVLSGPVGWIFIVIVIVVAFIAFFRTILTLLKAYINIVLSLIFSPFLILLGVIPGLKDNPIMSWFKSLLANLMVMPVTLTMLYLSCYITIRGLQGTQVFDLSIGAILRIIGKVGAGNELLPSATAESFKTLDSMILPWVGLGILWMVPQSAKIIQGFFAGKPFDYGTAIGEAINSVGKSPIGKVATLPAQSALKGMGTYVGTYGGSQIIQRWKERGQPTDDTAAAGGNEVSNPP